MFAYSSLSLITGLYAFMYSVSIQSLGTCTASSMYFFPLTRVRLTILQLAQIDTMYEAYNVLFPLALLHRRIYLYGHH